MNEEIKEILNYLKSSFRNYAVSHSDYLNWIKIIEDYITNLQQKLDKAESDNLILAIENEKLNASNYIKLDFKRRCEKAIDYIAIHSNRIAIHSNRDYNDVVDVDELLEILRGENEDV